jgi:hypothetical protein
MARHCTEAHDSHTLYLRKKDKAPPYPYKFDWKKNLMFPGKIWFRVPEHHLESESESSESS